MTLPAVQAQTFNLGDQSTIGWSRKFVYELALRLAPVQTICEAHGIARSEWDAIRSNPVFVADLKRANEALQGEGASFKVKAAMLAEDFLDKAHEMMHASHEDVDPTVKRNLLRDMVRHAGLDASLDQEADAAAKGAPKVAVQIVLS